MLSTKVKNARAMLRKRGLPFVIGVITEAVARSVGDTVLLTTLACKKTIRVDGCRFNLAGIQNNHAICDITGTC